MMKRTLRLAFIALALLGAQQVSAQRIASDSRHAWADTIPVDSLVARHVRFVRSSDRYRSTAPYRPLLSDYVGDPQSARGDTVFQRMLEIARSAQYVPLAGGAIQLIVRGEAARPGERTAALVDLFRGVLDERSHMTSRFLSGAQDGSPQFRAIAAGWIADELREGEVDEFLTEVLVGRLGALGEPGIAALRDLIEKEELPPMRGGLEKAREMLQRAIARRGGLMV